MYGDFSFDPLEEPRAQLQKAILDLTRSGSQHHEDFGEVLAAGRGCVEGVLGEVVGRFVTTTSEAIVVRESDGTVAVAVPWSGVEWFSFDRTDHSFNPEVFPSPTGQWITASVARDRWRLIVQPEDADAWIQAFRERGIREAAAPA
jgi:hypothetical protein